MENEAGEPIAASNIAVNVNVTKKKDGNHKNTEELPWPDLRYFYIMSGPGQTSTTPIEEKADTKSSG